MKAFRSSSILQKQKAFTLIEMLAVIGIIFFLAAMSLPALQQARETAKVTKCVANLRQISMNTFLYAADNRGYAPWPYGMETGSTWLGAPSSGNDVYVQTEGYFTARTHKAPASADPNSTFSSNYPAGKWFAEYFGDPIGGRMSPVGYCPAGGRFGPIGTDLPTSIKTLPYPNVSYMINMYLVNPDFFYNPNSGSTVARINLMPLASVPEPSKVCLWIEGLGNTAWPNNANVNGPHYAKSKAPRQQSSTAAKVIGGKTIFQQYGKANLVYVDQHIAMKKIPEELPTQDADPYNLDPNVTKEISYKFWTIVGRSSSGLGTALDDPFQK